LGNLTSQMKSMRNLGGWEKEGDTTGTGGERQGHTNGGGALRPYPQIKNRLGDPAWLGPYIKNGGELHAENGKRDSVGMEIRDQWKNSRGLGFQYVVKAEGTRKRLNVHQLGERLENVRFVCYAKFWEKATRGLKKTNNGSQKS